MRGLSGGQKRRLSLVLAFAKQPALVILDEPTSGLDSAAAASIMSFFGRSASEMNLAILCTIHQPSAKVFNGVDDCLVLSKGRTAYFGPAKDLISYLKSIGHPVPLQMNPAEFVLDLINEDFTDADGVDAVLDKWQPSAHSSALTTCSASMDLIKMSFQKAGIPAQIRVLFQRQLLLLFRDPTLCLGRALAALFTNVFFAILYIRSRPRVQQAVTTSSSTSPPACHHMLGA